MVSIILDTNSVIAYLNGDSEAAKHIELTPELYLPAIVIGELAYGAYKSARSEDNIKPIKEFSSVCQVLDCGESAAYEYGRIKNELRTKGNKIPENDMWIAACAIARDLPLLSRDAHFDSVDGLRRVAW